MSGIGLHRARWFLENAREATLEFADEVQQHSGCSPDPIVVQIPASLFDELLVDIDAGEREISEMRDRFQRVRRQALLVYVVATAVTILGLLASIA
jgi:hypothetical protein